MDRIQKRPGTKIFHWEKAIWGALHPVTPMNPVKTTCFVGLALDGRTIQHECSRFPRMRRSREVSRYDHHPM